MRTEKQIAASRANGARSRGPKTAEGKARSARNSTRHGMLARAILIEGESRQRFDELLRYLNDTLRPQNPVDELLIGRMAAAHWRLIRIWNLEREGHAGLSEHEMRYERQFFRNFDRYVRLRGFFGQTNPPNPAPALFPRKSEPGVAPEIPASAPETPGSAPDARGSEPEI